MLTFLRSKKDRFDDGIRGLLGAQSSLAIQKITIPTIDGDMDLADIAHQVKPRNDFSADMNEWKVTNLDHINRGLTKIVKAKELEIPTFYGSLWAQHIDESGQIVDYGLISLRVVTATGVGFIVDAFQNSVELETMKYHGLGTGTNSESSSDTALQTELTTAYTPDSTRPAGTTTEGATANIYKTVATNTISDASAAVTEHGIFSQAATGGGVMLDRSVFSVINLAIGDSLQTTYELTFNAGG